MASCASLLDVVIWLEHNIFPKHSEAHEQNQEPLLFILYNCSCRTPPLLDSLSKTVHSQDLLMFSQSGLLFYVYAFSLCPIIFRKPSSLLYRGHPLLFTYALHKPSKERIRGIITRGAKIYATVPNNAPPRTKPATKSPPLPLLSLHIPKETI